MPLKNNQINPETLQAKTSKLKKEKNVYKTYKLSDKSKPKTNLYSGMSFKSQKIIKLEHGNSELYKPKISKSPNIHFKSSYNEIDYNQFEKKKIKNLYQPVPKKKPKNKLNPKIRKKQKYLEVDNNFKNIRDSISIQKERKNSSENKKQRKKLYDLNLGKEIKNEFQKYSDKISFIGKKQKPKTSKNIDQPKSTSCIYKRKIRYYREDDPRSPYPSSKRIDSNLDFEMKLKIKNFDLKELQEFRDMKSP